MIDGYNLIKRNPQFAAKRLEEGRQALISFIERNRLQGSDRNSVTVIFDGQPGMYGLPVYSQVRVVFTEYESADDLIKSMVQEAKSPKSMVVVTDDKQLYLYVRALGASVLSGGEFLRKYTSAKTPPRPDIKKTEPSKVITSSFEHLINQEFEQLWVSKKNKKKDPEQ